MLEDIRQMKCFLGLAMLTIVAPYAFLLSPWLSALIALTGLVMFIVYEVD